VKLLLALAALIAPAEALAQAAIPTLAELKQAGGTLPKVLSGPEAEGKEAFFARGMQGEMLIGMTIGADGLVTGTSILTSSRAPELDAFAASLIARTRFEPARNKAGEAVAVQGRMPVYLWKDSLVDGSLFAKKCSDFIVDADWFAQAFPEKKPTDLRVWLLMTGASVSMPGGLNRRSPDYRKVYDACQEKPGRKFADVYMKLAG
jgi:TonB family protein